MAGGGCISIYEIVGHQVHIIYIRHHAFPVYRFVEVFLKTAGGKCNELLLAQRGAQLLHQCCKSRFIARYIAVAGIAFDGGIFQSRSMPSAPKNRLSSFTDCANSARPFLVPNTSEQGAQ